MGMDTVFLDISVERDRQDKKWGVDRSHPNEWWLLIMLEEIGEVGKAILENIFDYPDASPDDVRREIIETIAVGVAWLEDIDRRKE